MAFEFSPSARIGRFLTLGLLLLFLATTLVAEVQSTKRQVDPPEPLLSDSVTHYEIAVDFRGGKVEGLRTTINELSIEPGHNQGIFVSDSIELPSPFSHLAARWQANYPDGVTISVRGSRDGSYWSEWEDLNIDHDSGKDSHLYSGLIEFASKTKFFQYAVDLSTSGTSDSAVKDLTFFFIYTNLSSNLIGGKMQRPPPVGENMMSKPPLVSRTEWGCPDGQSSPDGWPPSYLPVTHLIVHHTADSNTSTNWAARVLAIWEYHANVQGWYDIAYNYLIDPNGVIYEGRAGGDDVMGGHFSCVNNNTMGVALLGNYVSVSPTPMALESLKAILAWQASHSGLDPLSSSYHENSRLVLDTISGHSDANTTSAPGACPKNTDCPGAVLYSLLPSIREEVYGILHISQPSSLAQFDNSGILIPVGSSIGIGTLTLEGLVTTPENKAVGLEVEVRRTSDPFNGDKTHSSLFLNPGATARICVTGLASGQYHWRARTVDQNGARSPWASFGANSDSDADFSVLDSNPACRPCSWMIGAAGDTTVSQGVVGLACGLPPLSVTLSASPQSGTAPLNDVDLTASVSNASGPTTYYFYCDSGDSNYAAIYPDTTENPKTALNICNYSIPRSYTAKVIVQSGSSFAEARTTITVTEPSPQPPSITTSNASNVTQGSAILNLSVTPNGSSTTVWFDYGTSSTNFSSSTSHQAVASPTETTLISMTVASLSCDTTYYFRARAENSEGGTTGDTLSFRTNACTGSEETVSLLSNTSFEQGNNVWWVASPAAYINGGLPNYPHPHTGNFYAFLSTPQWEAGNNLDGAMISPLITIPANATSAELRYFHSVTSGETSSTANDTLGVYLVKAGNQLVGIDTISNSHKTDNPDHYTERVVPISPSLFGIPVNVFFSGHTNATLPTLFRIDDVTLTAIVPIGGGPTATTQAADQITSSSARLKMAVNPNGTSTTVWFNLAANDPTPDFETDHLSIGSGSQIVNFTAFNLQCATTYYFRARAQNANGASQGSVLSFTTSSCPAGFPVANTNPATDITRTSVTFNAQVNPNGHSTEAWFYWGTTTNFGGETGHTNMGSGTGFVGFTRSMGGLTCNTVYYFQALASNSAGQGSGATLSFTTEPCAPPITPTIAVTALDDSASEAGLEIGTFRVSRTGSMTSSLPISYAMTGTAANGIDYVSLGSGAIIPAGSPSVDLTVQPIQDLTLEPDETVILTILPLDSYVIGTPASAMVTLRSDDGEGDCYVGMLSPAGGETWVKGMPQSVRWSASTGCVEFAVSLTHGDPAEELSMGSYISGNQFVFIPPAWLVPGSYQVKVTGFDSGGLATAKSTATSNVFSVVNHTILPSIIFEDTTETSASLNWSSYGWGIIGSAEFSHSPTHSHANIPALYGTNVTSYLLSPKIDLSGRRSLLLTFWQRFASANFGSVKIRVKDADGNYWYVRGLADWHSDWRPVTIDLSAFIGEPSIQISFESYTPNASAAGSWYVDDIKVYEPGPTDFYTITPCRVLDTRQGSGPLSGALSRSFLVAGTCGIPTAATAAYFNATVVNPTAGGYVRLFPADQLVPSTSTVNFQLGQTRANNTIIGLSADGRVGALANLGSGQTDLVLDVTGYFALTHPMLGLWRGLLSGFPVELTVEENGGVLTAWFNGVGRPRDQLAILYLSEAQIVADRPADGDAQVRLSREVSPTEECLVGEYFETGAGRSLTLCKVP